MKLFRIIAAVAFALLLSFASFSFAFPFAGLPVTQITLQDEAGRPWPHPEQLMPLINVQPGERLSADAVDKGVSYLYLKGLFKDVRVEAFPDGKGVRLVYILIPDTIVDHIEVRGNHALSAATIRDAVPGVEGKRLRVGKFPEYRAAIATLYQAEGYYDAGVDIRTEPLKEPHRVALRIDIREPPPTIIEAITFSGFTALSDKQLLKVMKSRPGKPLKSDVLLDQDLEAIRDAYSEAGYPAAKPGPVNIDFQDGKAVVHIYGSEGPKVTVRFSNNRAFSDSELRDQLLIWSEHDASDAIIESSADKIKNYYQDHGYAFAKVDVRKEEGPGRLNVGFNIREGLRVTVRKILITGNKFFSTKQIKAGMSLRESGWFSSAPYREDVLDSDVDYLSERYADEGFLDASVKKRTDFVDNGTGVIVSLEISEGRRTMVGRITFDGNAAFSAAKLLDLVTMKPGSPYNERLVDEDRYRILSAYSNKGYLYARVDAEKKIEGGIADITYHISEDRPVRIGRIILRGNERTKDKTIMRELLLRPGDRYDYGKILESQQHIYRFGYFNLARFAPVHPGEKEYVKDMLLTVEERPAGAVELGIGYGDLDRLRASAEVSYRNLWGLAHYGGIRLEASDILKRAVLNYQHPRFFGYDMQGKFALTWSDMKNINSDTREIYYQSRQTSASYGVEKAVAAAKMSFTYQFENVENYNVEPGAQLSPEDSGRVKISSLTPALVWDLRDDFFNPTRGALYGIAVKEALATLGSEADFSKLTVQGSWYFPPTSGVVLAFSARGGVARPYRGTAEIPIHERFYLGGSTTVRGYTQDSVGPQAINPDGTTVPTGGSSMALFNLEARVALGGGFGMVAFRDAGNVWVDQKIKLNDLRESYGLGIRYGTPIGPLRLDYGWKIRRRPGESAGEFHFNIGHTF